MESCLSDTIAGLPTENVKPVCELTHRFGQGETCAYEELVHLHQERITRLVWRLTGWRNSEVDDIVQDTFLTALKKQSQFNARGNVANWLTTIAVNQCRSWHRKRLLNLKLFKQFDHTPLAEPSDASLMDQETGRLVRQAVGKLPLKLREVTVFKYLEQLDIKEIARILKIEPNTVEVRLHRARQKLREYLGACIKDTI